MNPEPRPGPEPPPALAVAVVCYLTHLSNEVSASPCTVRSYMNSLGQFLDFARKTLGHDSPPLEALTTRLSRAWLAYLGSPERGLAPASISGKLSALRSFTAWCFKRGLVARDPAEALRPPPLPKTLPHVLGVEEVQTLMEQPNIKRPGGLRDRAILETLYSTGCRAAEALALDVTDVDLAEGLATVKGKGKKERLGILGPEATYYLLEYINRGRPSFVEGVDPAPGALFLNATHGTRLSTHALDYLFKNYARSAGLDASKATPHTLRHSFATHLLNNGANIREVQELLGHKSIATTVHYTQLSPRKVQDEYRKSHPRA